jgi:DNA polymerase III epsilon subunit-like protein/CBS domain-containing protein
VHSGAVDIVHEGKLLDLLGVGDAFGHTAMLSGLPPGFEAQAAEDTLCYRIPAAVARPLLDRVRSRELRTGVEAPSHTAVAKLIRSPTVRCEPSASIREVAGRMTELGANAAIVEHSEGFGIITDRDLRTRILARGLPFESAASEVMTTPVFSVTPDRLGGEVLFEMLERGIRHAPVITERGQLVGVVEDADLFAVQSRSWFGVRRSIAHAGDVEALAAAARMLPQLVGELHASSLRGIEIVRVLSALVDALTSRALDLAEPRSDPRADGLVWVALGGQARRELTATSVAEGAIVHSDAPGQPWLNSVRQTLERCGIPAAPVARTAAGWLSAEGGEELVLIERRPLWGTPREPLPIAEGPRRRALTAGARPDSADRIRRRGRARGRRHPARAARPRARGDGADRRARPVGGSGGWAARRLDSGPAPGRRGRGRARRRRRANAHRRLRARARAASGPAHRAARGRLAAERRDRPGGTEPARPRPAPRRVPRRHRGPAESARMRLRAPRGVAAAAFAQAGRPAGGTPWREAGWCAIDLELTGLDPRADEIIAVGAVPVQEGRVILGEAFYTLVSTEKRSGHAAILTHKLRAVDLADAPPVQEAIDGILDALRGRVPVFHAAAVERSFLSRPFSRRRVRLPDAADTDVLGRAWLRERDGEAPPWLALAELSELLGQTGEPPHHALGDALSTAQAFIALASHLDREAPQTVGSLLAARERLAGPRAVRAPSKFA